MSGMMKHAFLSLLMILFMTSAASAVVYTDNFSMYTSYFRVINETNNPQEWTLQLDANAVSAQTNYIKYAPSGLKVESIVAQTPDPRASMATYPNPTINLADFNAKGVMYYWIKLDGNLDNIWRTDIRIGMDQQHYYSYFDIATPIVPGFMLRSYDMNCDKGCFVPALGGSTFDTTGYVDVAVHGEELPGSGTDFNFTVNKIWIEKTPNAFNGKWRALTPRSSPQLPPLGPQGWALPTKDNGRWVMQLASADGVTIFPGVTQAARYVYTPLEDVNIADYNVHLQAKIKKPYYPDGTYNTNPQTKLVFDYVDPLNMSSVYVEDVNDTHANVGVEQFISGQRSAWYTTVPYGHGTYHFLKAEMNGKRITVYKNGVLILTADLNTRRDGSVGIFSLQGTSFVTEWAVEYNNQDKFRTALFPCWRAAFPAGVC